MIELLIAASLITSQPSVPNGTLTDWYIDRQRHSQTLDQMNRMRDPTPYDMQRSILQSVEKIGDSYKPYREDNDD